MLIPSSWHFKDLWLEEEQSIQSGRTVEQILWVSRMNYSEYSKRCNVIRSRASYKKMEQIGFYDSYGRGLGTPNSICKNYFGRIVEDPQSLLE